MAQAQVILCRCGGVFAACTVPECYTSGDWMRELKQYAKKGYAIEMRDSVTFDCRCKSSEIMSQTEYDKIQEKQKAKDEANYVNPNQLQLFV
jgi:hypothetical protein